jgi:hypothetical protein
MYTAYIMFYSAPTLPKLHRSTVSPLIVSSFLQGACGIILPIIKAEGVRQMFFPATVPAYYRSPKDKTAPAPLA